MKINLMCYQNPHVAKGIGLIEVLIAIFVLAIGVLGLVSMQGVFLSSDASNKAKSEAIAIAQSRLEEMRNYMNEVETVEEFNTLYAVVNDANNSTINGVNSVFNRTETIVANGERRTISVNVSWDGGAEIVTLNTDLSFIPPRGAGDLAIVKEDSLITSPTGRARRGEGVPTGTPKRDNNDGTFLYSEGENLNLVYDGKIVLTLEEACDTSGGNCTDFVKIKGRVYIDTTTQKSLDSENVFVHASEAAFCSRYYLDNSGNARTISPSNPNGPKTATGDYEYFDYTCHLGGGWHGNIGVLISGGIALSDKVCLGDPISTNAWEAPVIALRRAYRGMVFEKDGSGNPIRNVDGDIIYSSYGIADAVELPDPNTSDHTHDFVISSMSASDTEGSNCISQGVMVRSDSNIHHTNGDLFEGNPGDFFCLNDGYLDTFDSGIFGADATCPYDPTNPPVERHVISGSVAFNADDDALRNAIQLYTSDGPGNCLLGLWEGSGSNYAANYKCDVFDWGSGWNGSIFTTAEGYETKLSCDPAPLSLQDVARDEPGQNISCSVGNFALIVGSVTTTSTRRVLDSVSISGGECSVSTDGLSYSCRTDSYVESWDGLISFTATGGYICESVGIVNTGSITLAGGSGSANAVATEITEENQLGLVIANNVGSCP